MSARISVLLLNMARICAVVVALGLAPAAMAHEIRASVADVTVTDTTVTLDITLVLEPLVAQIDLSQITDTNDAPEAEAHDALRALDPAALEAALRESWPAIVGAFRLNAGATPLTPEITEVTVGEIGNVELPRESRLVLTAALPADGSDVVVGWDARLGQLVVRQGEGEGSYSAFLTDGALSDPLPRDGVREEGALQAFWRYVLSGFDHIVPKGLDHILFVLGLFFFALQLKPLLVQVSAFTVAHTITLALAATGTVSISPAIVEPLIAASIAYVAVENIIGGPIGVRRTVLVTAFGLLHGLGFASVLQEFGLGGQHFLTKLVGFNIGVELGQLAVIAAAFVLVGLPFGKKEWYRRAIAIPASVVIGLIGAYWVIERTLLA